MDKEIITTHSIEQNLRHYFGNYDYHLNNSYVFDWESDFFAISKSGYCVEVEVKVSKSDFKADFKKTDKHHRFKNANKKILTFPGLTSDYSKTSAITIRKNTVPNQFYYCCPKGLINIKDVPEYAGLFYVDGERYSQITLVKRAKYLHKDKFLSERWFVKTLMNKFYYQSLNQKHRINELEYELKRKHKIHFQNKEIDLDNDLTLF